MDPVDPVDPVGAGGGLPAEGGADREGAPVGVSCELVPAAVPAPDVTTAADSARPGPPRRRPSVPAAPPAPPAPPTRVAPPEVPEPRRSVPLATSGGADLEVSDNRVAGGATGRPRPVDESAVTSAINERATASTAHALGLLPGLGTAGGRRRMVRFGGRAGPEAACPAPADPPIRA